MRALPLLLLSAALAGCSEYDMKNGSVYDDSGAELNEEQDPDEVASPSLRLDVLPSAGLMQQSFPLDDDRGAWLDLNLDLQRTIEISGQILGFDANPYSLEPEIPGDADVPVVAQVTLTRPGTVVTSSAISDSGGDFSLQIPAIDPDDDDELAGYQLAIQPISPADMPFLVQTNQRFTATEDLEEIDLGYGYPVYGNILDDDGEPVHAQVRLVDSVTGVAGAAAETDPESGFFLLRAAPGGYTLRIEGLDQYRSAVVPTIEMVDFGFEADAGGVETSIVVGTLEPVAVGGHLVDAEGDDLEDARIRFTAEALYQVSEDPRLTFAHVVESESDGNGEFGAELLPGEWKVEIIPAYSGDHTRPHPAPLLLAGDDRLVIDPGEDEVDMGTVELPERVLVRRQVYTPDVSPLAGVLVLFVEQGFDRAAYQGYTDEDGWIELYVPPVPLAISLAPPQTRKYAITRFSADDPTAIGTSGEWYLVEGEAVSGRVTRPDGVENYANITIRDGTGAEYGTTLTDAEGNFEVRIQP